MQIVSPTWERIESYGRIARELARRVSSLGKTRLVLCYPDVPHSANDVILTMWESTCLPPKWVDAINTYRACIVPSRWCADVFRANGVTVPLHVVPLGVSDIFHYTPRSQGRPFTILALADRGRRKHWDTTVFAFIKAFGADPHYQLILKTRRLNALRLGNPNITVLADDLEEQAIAQLYAACDCMAFPSAAEGWGFPPREFAATGGDVLATRWSGTADDLDAWGIALDDFQMEPAFRMDDHWSNYDAGVWAAPSVDELAEKMRWCAAHRATVSERGYQAASAIGHLYSWHTCASAIEGIVWQH